MKTWKLRERQRAQRAARRIPEPQLLVPTEKIHQLGNYQSVGVVQSTLPPGDAILNSTVGVPIDIVLPLGIVLAGEDHDHDWQDATVIGNVVVRGCGCCSAIERLPNPPDPGADRDELERWLNS